jgi:hypothetical protein
MNVNNRYVQFFVFFSISKKCRTRSGS